MFCNRLSCWHSNRENHLQQCHLNDTTLHLSVKKKKVLVFKILAAFHSIVHVELKHHCLEAPVCGSIVFLNKHSAIMFYCRSAPRQPWTAASRKVECHLGNWWQARLCSLIAFMGRNTFHSLWRNYLPRLTAFVYLLLMFFGQGVLEGKYHQNGRCFCED